MMPARLITRLSVVFEVLDPFPFLLETSDAGKRPFLAVGLSKTPDCPLAIALAGMSAFAASPVPLPTGFPGRGGRSSPSRQHMCLHL